MPTIGPAGGNVLEINGLSIELTGRGKTVGSIVHDVSMRIGHREIVGLIGESGSGKTIAAKSLIGLLPSRIRVTEGTAMFRGTDLFTLSPKAIRKIRGKDISVIPQDALHALNPVHRIGRQVGEPLSIHTDRSGSAIRAMVLKYLAKVKIDNPRLRARQYPHQFSGGMQQRALTAMALSTEPSLIIADEPTTALDVTIQAQILTLLGQLQADLGLSLLLITHDLGVVAAIANDVAVMYAGRIVERAPAADLFATPRHPYTKGLLAAIPVPGVTARGSALPAIPGRVPGLIGTMAGCAFRDRCAIAGPECAVDPVPRISAGGAQFIECAKASEVAA